MEEEKRWISSEALFEAIEELLAEHRQAVFTVTGMSMWPFLCHGRDQVIVEQCDPAELRKGDIVLFQTGMGNYLLHRITRLENGFFETTGDGNCFRDGWFPLACVRARVCTLIRKGKRISCDAAGWKLIFRLWGILFPVRRGLLWGLKAVSRLKRTARSALHRTA